MAKASAMRADPYTVLDRYGRIVYQSWRSHSTDKGLLRTATTATPPQSVEQLHARFAHTVVELQSIQRDPVLVGDFLEESCEQAAGVADGLGLPGFLE